MRHLFYFFLISIIAFWSCDSQDNNKSAAPSKSQIREDLLVGKWHRFSFKNGYSEFDIDSQYVDVFSQKNGRSRLEYKVENDSFKYLDIDYSAKIELLNDSMLVLKNGMETATLYRFDGSSGDVFDSIPEDSDSTLFKAYLEKFNKKAKKEWAKAGFFIEETNPQNPTQTQ
jgi:hypothetical protein